MVETVGKRSLIVNKITSYYFYLIGGRPADGLTGTGKIYNYTD